MMNLKERVKRSENKLNGKKKMEKLFKGEFRKEAQERT